MDNLLARISNTLLAFGASDEEISIALKEAASEERFRKLNNREYEIFAGAVARAVAINPYMSDSIALIRPYRDLQAETIYTDKYSRVGIGAVFFCESVPAVVRASMLLHEGMHVLNNHFTRKVPFGIDELNDNITKDMEINSLLLRDSRVSLPHAVVPKEYNFPELLSYEMYANLMKERGLLNETKQNAKSNQKSEKAERGKNCDSGGTPGTGTESSNESGDSGEKQEKQDSQVSNSISSCESSSPERESGADSIGVERASSSEQALARSNTIAKIREAAEKAKARGNKSMLSLLQKIELAMSPSKVNWRTIFRNTLTNSFDTVVLGRSDYSYRRINRRTSGEFIFPGMVSYEPKVTIGIDTSGSMSKEELTLALIEVEEIAKKALRRKDSLRVFCVDSKVSKNVYVDSVRKLQLFGGGGTDMSKAIEALEVLPKKSAPDVFVLVTDGGTDWGKFKKSLVNKTKKYKTVILLTEKTMVNVVTKDLHGLAKVIDISED